MLLAKLIGSIENYKPILGLVFRCISLIRNKGIPERYQNETCELEEIDFRFSEKSEPDEYATFIADQMPDDAYVARRNLISSSQLAQKWGDVKKAKE
jgi:insulysin